ncbi:MAG: outer membrane beta-barrel protein [Bacteroidales bacterium]|nr:outer membrane beta-barrel protein [Bacteroidales bacterium]
MKRKLFSLAVIVLTLIGLSMNQVKAQSPAFFDGFSIKAGAGLTTFYGEMSGPKLLYITKQAGYATGFEKMFTPALGIQFQLLGGNLYSHNPTLSRIFEGTVQEFSLSAKIKPISLFNSAYAGKLHPYLRGGLGIIGFRAVMRDQNTNTIFLPAYGFATDGSTKTAKKNALSIPLAAGLEYHLTDRLVIELDQSFSITNTDILDALGGSTARNDIFGFTQIGLKFRFGRTQSDEPINLIAPATNSDSRKARKTKQPTKTRNRRNSNIEAENPIIEDPATKQITGPITNIFVESIIPEKPVSGKAFEVKLRINKSDYEGPAILTQIYPAGFTALESELGHSNFSFINQKVRLIWDNMPKDSIITYSYLVRPDEMVHDSQTINGSFEYKEQDEPILIQFANYIFVDNIIESEMDAKILKLLGDDTESVSDETKQNITQLEKEKDLELQIEDLLRKYGTDNTEKTLEKETQIAANKERGTSVAIFKHQAKQGVEFRIQCAAFRVQSEGQRIIRRYNITEPVTEDYHNGLYKYTVGSFATYNEAAKYRDTFIKRSKIWTAFIVAYENGKRLNSLSQALR